MRQRSTQRRGTLVKRSLQIIASLVLASVGWFLLGESEELTAAETAPSTHSEGVENVVARFDGVAVTEDEVMTAAAHELVELEKQRRELISKTARRVVHQRLIAAEAERLDVTPEELTGGSEDYEELASRLEHEYHVEYLTELGTFAMGGSPASADADS
ncbi:MAG: hypothetical protein V3T72_07625 [Thermoanaerobaculia bacterium]